MSATSSRQPAPHLVTTNDGREKFDVGFIARGS
jgi:hypothetical protein